MSELADIIAQNQDQIRTDWLRDMAKSLQRSDLMSRAELEEQSRAVLNALVEGARISGPRNFTAKGWASARELLEEISSSRARQGFTPTEIASFVLSLKQPLFSAIWREQSKNQDKLFDTVWAATEMLDRLA
jgi:rsbT co-antagonist protein RsbR